MAKQNISYTNRVCLACVQNHNVKTCPLIEKKLNKYTNYHKKNHLIGNILLKCIEKNVDFLQILLEIAEQNEEAYDLSQSFNTILPIENAIEYFAVSLECSSREFFREPQKTVEKYAKLMSSSYLENPFLTFSDDGRVDSINFSTEIAEYKKIETIDDYVIPTLQGSSYILSKKRTGEDRWIYNLYLKTPITITQEYKEGYKKEIYPYARTYYFSDMISTSPTEFLLASDCNGIFEKIFEKELSRSWMNDGLIQDLPLSDSRYRIWIDKLLTATRQRLLRWEKFDDNETVKYHTFYERTEVFLYINGGLKNKSDFQENISNDMEVVWSTSGKPVTYSGTDLYIRNREGGLGTCFRDAYKNRDDVKYDKKAVVLAQTIDSHRVDEENDKFLSELNKKVISHTDVIVTACSMICHDHYIEPLRGIVYLLSDDNKQIEYEIYVGYCSECNRYYCFNEDYKEMLKHGTPLCAVYNESDISNKKTVKPFCYKSQSVLNAMGYSVGMELNLPAEERQQILGIALQNKTIEIHDLISFLNWLIQTRKTQSKYEVAISKWQEDLQFVKKFELEEREKVNIKGIFVKR